VVIGAMDGTDVQRVPLDTHFAAFDQLVPHFWLMIHGLLFQDGADVSGLKPGFTSLYALASGVLIVALAAAPFAVMRRRWREPVAQEPVELARFAWLVFWVSAASLTMVGWVLSDQATDVWSARYLVPVFFAGAATLPVLVARSDRAAALVLTLGALLGFNGVLAVAQGHIAGDPRLPPTGDVNNIARAAAAHGLRYGYGSYWNAASVTWLSRSKVQVAPVEVCGTTFCRAPWHWVADWYGPRPGTHTFVVVDPNQSGLPGPAKDLGKPLNAWPAGNATIYEFDYDVATKFAR
jgi:hypothetical protein